MLPPFLGAVLLFGTIVAIGLAFLVALAARRRRPALGRRALMVAGTLAGVYASFWMLGLALARTTVYSPGSQIRFCGLDCHLHVSVTGVRPDSGQLGVTVRFMSNAVRAPEWPGKLRFRLLDDEGREFAPLNTVPETPLPAGAESSFELRFPGDAHPAGAVLIVTWDGGLDYLVPGAGNVLVQRRRRLALPAESRSGV